MLKLIDSFVTTITVALALVALTFGGCRKAKPPAPSRSVQASQLPPIKVRASKEMLLTYYSSTKQGFDTASKVDDIPEKRRGWVRVVDLKTKPGHRQDHELVYVADLRKAKKDGTFHYLVMSRAGFEAAAQNRASGGAAEPHPAKQPSSTTASSAKSAKVVLYSTSWCPACKSARRWLKENKVPFVEKDIEQDSEAAAELMSKAQKAGVATSGVPVLDVAGTLVQGFNPAQVLSLLGGKK